MTAWWFSSGLVESWASTQWMPNRFVVGAGSRREGEGCAFGDGDEDIGTVISDSSIV